MSDHSDIEWTDATWNPVRGCKLKSPGCANCYAMGQAHRFSGPGAPYEGLTRLRKKGGAVWTGEFREIEDALDIPLRWRKPRKIFVNSMSDLFGEGVSNGFIDEVLARMLLAPQHTFQVLTKRADRIEDYLSDERLYERVLAASDRVRAKFPKLARVGISNPTTNPAPWIWWGVSVEDQERADERIPHFLRVPAAVRFLSIEPLLGPVDLAYACFNGADSFGTMPGIHWVIVGGESGPGARPMHPDWVRSIRDQCAEAGVPFFFKQWGEHDQAGRKLGKKAAGRVLDGRTWDEVPNG